MLLQHLICNATRSRMCSVKRVSDIIKSSRASVTSSRIHNYSRPYMCSSLNVGLPLHKPVVLQNVKSFSTAPPVNAKADDHSKMWNIERYLSAGLIVLVPAAFLYPCALFDTVLVITLVMHNHWGIEANIVDYIRPKIFGKIVPLIAHLTLYLLSILTLTGSYFIIFNDAGFTNFIRMLWKL